MKALVISESYLPKLGGVEKHIASSLPYLQKAGLEVDIISKNQIFGDRKLPKFFGLLQIWQELYKRVDSIKKADIVIVHDVFIYYLPFRLLFPKKKVITVFHGWEKIYPIPQKNIFYKQLAQFLSDRTISIGSYINKHYHLNNKNNSLCYGAVTMPSKETKLSEKEKDSFVFVGRLEEDTGLSIFLDFLDILSKEKIIFSVKFCGDGPLRNKCQSYGEVLGFVDVRKYLEKSENCFAGGYLSILEAMVYKNYVLSAYQNPLKKDYLVDSPFAQSIAIGNDAKKLFENYLSLKKQKAVLDRNYKLAKEHSYKELANLYLQLINK